MRIQTTFTGNSGPTPVQVSTLSAFNADLSKPLIADRILIQMKAGATVGLGYVIDGVYFSTQTTNDNTAPTNPTAPTRSGSSPVELAAATSTVPGGTYTDEAYQKDGAGIDLRKLWVDADNGVVMTISVDLRD